MSTWRRCRGGLGLTVLLGLIAVALGSGAAPAGAAAPILGEAFSSEVGSASARLNGQVNPNGQVTTFHFDYTTKLAYEANLAGGGDGFGGAKKAPPVADPTVGSGSSLLTVTPQVVFNLQPDTAYAYRLKATNGSGVVAGSARFFTTRPSAAEALLPDGRGWEMVSPIAKNGGQVDPPETIASGGLLQAAATGATVTYSSAASFAGGQGAPPVSQYLATRTAGGWATQNLTVAIFSGSYDTSEGGAPYRLFSGDLSRGLLLNGKSCRGEATSGCPVPNPVLAGTDAPSGYQDYYLRGSTGSFEALLSSADIAGRGLDPENFELSLAGATPDLGHVILSSCAPLSAGASDGCPAQDNLYEWSPGGAPTLINVTPGAALAAQSAAVSDDGSRIYFYASGNLFLRDGGALKQADSAAGGGGSFQTASADGSVAYFSKENHVWRYRTATDSATDVTPSGGVEGVLGAAADGSHLYYLSTTGLWLCAAANTAVSCDTGATKVAADADASDYPPATSTSRVSAGGTKLAFVATAPLSGYDNTDLNTGLPDSQVYLYDSSGAGTLTCASCNPTGQRPLGPSTIPGAIANGAGTAATRAYKPRVLSANGRRLFFDSGDALALTDTNSSIADAYQWEASGEGSCTRPGGCVALISSGRDPAPSRFIDASADGGDAYFLTARSLVGADPGALDLYDARIGGGFAVPSPPIPCQGDACQVLPQEPTDPTLTTLLSGPGNPATHYHRYKHHFKRTHKKTQGKQGKDSKSHRQRGGKR